MTKRYLLLLKFSENVKYNVLKNFLDPPVVRHSVSYNNVTPGTARLELGRRRAPGPHAVPAGGAGGAAIVRLVVALGTRDTRLTAALGVEAWLTQVCK